ncbi:hypothetical protein MMC07_005172 [Pseudocyphellaria aurata]|nr:hypothetical protein [Pseudocyphellaria aurata]
MTTSESITMKSPMTAKVHFRPASSNSSFESFVTKLHEPAGTGARSPRNDYSPNFPAQKLLSILPQSSILALRQVSRATKAWAESGEISLFDSLHIEYPALDLYSTIPTAFHHVSQQCHTLTVSIVGSESPLLELHPIPEQSKLPAFPRLTHLLINSCASHSFEPLLAFRIFLQSADVPLLSRITIDSLTLDGIRALRWGPFSSFVETGWRGSMVWRRINALEVRLLPWWSSRPRPSAVDMTMCETEAEQQQNEKLEERSGVKILHDWVKSFEDNRMERLRFEWPEQTIGYNPLLLVESAAKDQSRVWFSALAIESRGCKEIWLGGCYIGLEEMKLLKERLRGLERVVVWRGWLGPGFVGTRSTVDGTDWVTTHLEQPKEKGKRAKKRIAGDVKVENPDLHQQALDDETTEEEELEELEDETALSDTSMDVPFFLEL